MHPVPPQIGPWSRVVLRIQVPPDAERILPVEVPGRYLIGSENQAAICIAPQAEVSRRHALLQLEPGTARVSDLDSSIGTYVNDRRVSTAVLRNGDRIRCGKAVITVTLESADPLTKTITPAAAEEAAADAERNLPPEIKGYSALVQIGQGALGTVYRAQQLGTNRQVAIKCIRPDLEPNERARQLFIREASITAQLKHPKIVEYLGFGLLKDRPYLVMEYIASENLEQIVWRHNPARRVRLAVKIAVQVLEALAYAHAAGIVHRDVKPSNILANAQTGRLFLKVSDFGLAKVFHMAGYSGITASNEICGTLAYMSPEQLMNSRHAQPQSDVYSVMVCLYRLLTGEYPHQEGTAVEMIHRRLNEAARPVQSFNPEIPDDLARIVDFGLSRALEMRYPSATALHTALEALPLLKSSQ